MNSILECCSSRAVITALTTATGGIDGIRNLYSLDDGRLILENIGVKT